MLPHSTVRHTSATNPNPVAVVSFHLCLIPHLHLFVLNVSCCVLFFGYMLYEQCGIFTLGLCPCEYTSAMGCICVSDLMHILVFILPT